MYQPILQSGGPIDRLVWIYIVVPYNGDYVHIDKHSKANEWSGS